MVFMDFFFSGRILLHEFSRPGRTKNGRGVRFPSSLYVCWLSLWLLCSFLCFSSVGSRLPLVPPEPCVAKGGVPRLYSILGFIYCSIGASHHLKNIRQERVCVVRGNKMKGWNSPNKTQRQACLESLRSAWAPPCFLPLR